MLLAGMSLVVLSFFFFQAEDGIRDLVRSRGLGDVYKRQDLLIQRVFRLLDDIELTGGGSILDRIYRAEKRGSVSYTHLTLPTSDLV